MILLRHSITVQSVAKLNTIPSIVALRSPNILLLNISLTRTLIELKKVVAVIIINSTSYWRYKTMRAVPMEPVAKATSAPVTTKSVNIAPHPVVLFLRLSCSPFTFNLNTNDLSNSVRCDSSLSLFFFSGLIKR